MEVEIAKMKMENVTAVVALERSCDLSSRGEERYSELLQEDHWLLLVAIQAFQVVGVFSGLMVVDELQIDNVAVEEKFRHRGIASQLLAKALEMAKKEGMKTAILEVRTRNLPARSLYERFGFTIAGHRKNYYQYPPDDALLLLLNISNYKQNAT